MTDIVELRNLVKRYGKVEAINGLDLTVREGDVYGFLGRNGAGKSTTIRILVGITLATSGSIHLFGQPTKSGSIKARQRIGYVAQEQHFYGWMNAQSIGRFVSGFYPTWDDAVYQKLIRSLDLPPQRKIQTYSGGMRAKLALALALAHRPPLLVLDEPTAGLDPVARHEFIEMVRDQAEHEGRTTFFSSHRIDEVEQAATRLGIIEDGRMRYEGSLQDLSDHVRLLKSAQAEAEVPLLEGGWVLQDRVTRGERQIVLQGPSPEWFETLPLVEPWTLERLHLEDIFLALVSRRLPQ